MMDKKNKYNDREMFGVPENYFEELTEKMMRSANSKQDTRNTRFFAIARPHIMLAASMIFLVIISYATLKLILPDTQDKRLELDADSITEYLANEIDETILIESSDMSDSYLLSENDPGSDFSEDEIIDYLIDGNINYEDILENL